ncbi:MAG: VOC family protein [Fimbriimonadaceae bacterium]|nr:VOC family protein [Alphaproteobacteria bacterium]
MARGIDHLVLAVRDLESARDVYSKLGFTCTPKAQHGWGTANFLVQMQGNFLEILTVDRPELLADPGEGEFSFGRFNETYLQSGEGFAMLVLESRDSGADLEDFRAHGLHTYAPFGFSRQAILPSGEGVTVSFSLAIVGDKTAPDIGFFTCQQHAPEYFWKREYQSHANGAQRVGEIVMISENPLQHRAFLEGFSGSDQTEVSDSGTRIETPRGALSVVTPDAARADWGGALDGQSGSPRLAAYVVEVDRLDAVRGILSAENIPCDDREDRLIVAPSDALGVAVAFVERS